MSNLLDVGAQLEPATCESTWQLTSAHFTRNRM